MNMNLESLITSHLELDKFGDTIAQIEALNEKRSNFMELINAIDSLKNNLRHRVFDEWKQKYDVIIVDTAASAVVPDAAQLARYADGYIYVVRSNYAAASRIREGMDMLSGTNCSPIGCVINKY